MEKYMVVCLKQNKLVALKESWVQKPTLGALSRVCYSVDEHSIANFHLDPTFFFDSSSVGCYDARVIKRFDNLDEAKKFCAWKRPQFHRTGKQKFCFDMPTVVDNITADQSDEGRNSDGGDETDTIATEESVTDASQVSLLSWHFE